MVSYRIIVYGTVQGVGFRYYTCKKAKTCFIQGWVRNNNDGTVEIQCQGEKKNMNEFLYFIKKGPQFSNVHEVITQSLSAQFQDGFFIKT